MKFLTLNNSLRAAVNSAATLAGKVAAANSSLGAGCYIKFKRGSLDLSVNALSSQPLVLNNGIVTITSLLAPVLNPVSAISSLTDTIEIYDATNVLRIGPEKLVGPNEVAPDPAVTPYVKVNKELNRAGKLGKLDSFVVAFTGLSGTTASNERWVGPEMFAVKRSEFQLPWKITQNVATVVTSDPVVMNGFDAFVYNDPVDGPQPRSLITHVSGDGQIELSVNNGPFSSGNVAIQNGDTLQARRTTENAYGYTRQSSIYLKTNATATNFDQANAFLLGYWTTHTRNDFRAPQTFQIGPTRVLKQLTDLPPLAAGDTVRLDNGNVYGPPSFKATLNGVGQTLEFDPGGNTARMTCFLTGDFPNCWKASLVFEVLLGSMWVGIAAANGRTGVPIPAGTPIVGGNLVLGANPGDNNLVDERATDGYWINPPANALAIRVRCTSYTSGNIYVAWGLSFIAYYDLNGGGMPGLPITFEGVGPGPRAIILGGGGLTHAGTYEAVLQVNSPHVVVKMLEFENGYGLEQCAVRVGKFGTCADNVTFTQCLMAKSKAPWISLDNGVGTITLDRCEVRDADTSRGRDNGGHAIYAGGSPDAAPDSQITVLDCFVHSTEGNGLKLRTKAEVIRGWVDMPDAHNNIPAGYFVRQAIGLYGPQGPNRARNYEQIVSGTVIVARNIVGNNYAGTFFGDGTSQVLDGRIRFEKCTFIAAKLQYGFNCGPASIGDSFHLLNCAFVSPAAAPSPGLPYGYITDFGGEFQSTVKIKVSKTQIPINSSIPRTAWNTAAVATFDGVITGQSGIANRVMTNIDVTVAPGSPLYQTGHDLSTHQLPAGYETTRHRTDWSIAAWRTRPIPGVVLQTPTVVGSPSSIGA
jgi:hypothetical protein